MYSSFLTIGSSQSLILISNSFWNFLFVQLFIFFVLFICFFVFRIVCKILFIFIFLDKIFSFSQNSDLQENASALMWEQVSFVLMSSKSPKSCWSDADHFAKITLYIATWLYYVLLLTNLQRSFLATFSVLPVLVS